MYGRRLILAALLLVVGLSSLVGGARAAPTTLRVGYFPNITHAQAVLGFGQKVFTTELRGVDVQGKVFNAGPDEMNALFAGAIDIGYIGPGPAINGYVKSHGSVVIVAGASTGGTVLVARAGSGIKGIADLANKKVAIPQVGNTQDIELRALLKDNNLSPSESGGSVRVLAVQNPDTLALFQKGAIDAALVPEPWGSRLVKETGATVVLDNDAIYGGTTPAAVIVASAAFVRAYPDLLVRFLRVHDQLTRGLDNNRAGIRPALNAQIKALTGKALADDVLTNSLARTRFSTRLYTRELDRFARFSVTAGYLKASASLTGLVNPWPLAHLLDRAIK